MTEEEFLTKHHHYSVHTREQAETYIAQLEPVYDQQGTFSIVVPVHFPGQGWCVMLKKAAETVWEIYPELKGA